MRSWLAERSVPSMRHEDAAWLAGFIDGEGTIGVYGGKGRRQNQRAWVLRVSNTSLAALEKCRRLTNAGDICRKVVRGARKPAWQWSVHRQRDLHAILDQIEPFLAVKHEAALAFLATWKDVAAGVVQRPGPTGSNPATRSRLHRISGRP